MKKYYLVQIDSYEDYYNATGLYKAKSEKDVRKYLEENFASDQYIVSINEVDYENNKEEVMSKVSCEKKIYRDYIEIL